METVHYGALALLLATQLCLSRSASQLCQEALTGSRRPGKLSEFWPATWRPIYGAPRALGLKGSKPKVGTVWRLGLVHVVHEEANITRLLAELVHRTLRRLPP